jgi:hypothetical protein
MPFLFGTVFLAISALWASGEIESRYSFAWYHIPILMVGPALMLSPAWYFFEAKRTSYAVTDRRAVIDLIGLLPVRTSVPLGRIALIQARPRGGDTGHVHFLHIDDPGPEVQLIKTIHREGFVAVSDVCRVERLLRNAVDSYKRGAAA